MMRFPNASRFSLNMMPKSDNIIAVVGIDIAVPRIILSLSLSPPDELVLVSTGAVVSGKVSKELSELSVVEAGVLEAAVVV